jgi:hypothetical protein
VDTDVWVCGGRVVGRRLSSTVGWVLKAPTDFPQADVADALYAAFAAEGFHVTESGEVPVPERGGGRMPPLTVEDAKHLAWLLTANGQDPAHGARDRGLAAVFAALAAGNEAEAAGLYDALLVTGGK